MSESDAISMAGERPITQRTIEHDLLELGVSKGMSLLVHTAMSSMGWVCGGPMAIIYALETVLGEEGTLVMPTQSGGLSDPAAWQAPPVPESWWATIRETMPAYDPDLTPTRGMGAVSECFRKQRGVLRSAHPSSSFAAWGKHAHAIVDGHLLEYSLGENSPLARLYELDAYVLLIGVGHDQNTSIHLAQYRSEYPGKRFIQCGAPIIVNGKRVWASYIDLDFETDVFHGIGEDFDKSGSVRIGRIGHATSRLMSQRALVDFCVASFQNLRGVR